MKKPDKFDDRFVLEVEAALSGLPENAVPRWGAMTRKDLIEHLLAALRYSLSEAPFDIPPQAGPWRRKLLRWLILTVGVPMPRNVRFRSPAGETLPLARVAGGLADLGVALRRVARATPADVPQPPAHPYLGTLSLEEWRKLHRLHIRHHLRQFGLAF